LDIVQDSAVAEPLERCLGCVVPTPDLGLTVDHHSGLLLESHDGLKEVVVETHKLVEVVDGPSLSDGIVTPVSQVSTNQGEVLLLHEARIVLAPRAIAREANVGDQVWPEAEHMPIEELGAIVEMDLLDGKGQAVAENTEGVHHDRTALAQNGASFAPAGGHIDHLEGVDKVTFGAGARVKDQIRLKVPRFSLIPADDLHGHSLLDLVGSRRRLSGQAFLDLALVTCHEAIDGGSADLAQALLHLTREPELSMSFQVLGYVCQHRL
jgi:hypothetical protein